MIKNVSRIILLLFQVGCTISASPQPSPTALDKPLSPIEQVLDNQIQLIQGQALVYNGIKPGVSTRTDIEARWGPPNSIKKYQNFESLHYFTTSQEYFLLKNGVVYAITSNTFTPSVIRGSSALRDLEDRLKDPQILTPTFGSPIRVHPDFGLAYSNRFYQFFIPMSLREYAALWGAYPLEYDPFPLMPSVDQSGIVVGQTTRSGVEQSLGAPDYIAVSDENRPWVYDLEPDLFGRVHVAFNARDQVVQVDIEEVQKAYTFADTVKQYGPPDFVQRLPDIHGRKYGTMALLYLKRGLRALTGCFLDSCDSVKKDANVVQKLYFTPTTYELYRVEFSESDFKPWQGFDE